MDLVIFFDHRFVEGQSGAYYSLKSYSYSFFLSRYLSVFDHVKIICRTSDSPLLMAQIPSDAEPTNGDRVSLISLGDWQGLGGFLKKRQAIRATLKQVVQPNDAVLLIAPGMIAYEAHDVLTGDNRPYGVEVVGDPYDSFSPGAVRHPLSLALRILAPWQLRRVCRDASVASYVTREALQRRYPCKAASFGISDVELPREAFVEGPRRFGNEQKVIICVGTMAQMYKRQDLLIRAVARINANQPNGVQLLLVGDGKYRPQLEALADDLGQSEAIQFLGQLPAGTRIRKALDQSSLFVLASNQEGLPRTMLEAMARGLPCIGSTVGGIPEILERSELVPVGDLEALTNRIIELLSDERRLEALSADNLEKAKGFGSEALLRERLAFYRLLAERAVEHSPSLGPANRVS